MASFKRNNNAELHAEVRGTLVEAKNTEVSTARQQIRGSVLVMTKASDSESFERRKLL